MYIPHTAAFALSLLSLLGSSHAQDTSDSSLTDVLAQYSNFSSFSALLTQQFPRLLNALETGHDAKTNPITILAPSNKAFESIQYSDVLGPAWANNDTAFMSQVIGYHTVEGAWTAQTLNTSFQFLTTSTNGGNFSNVSGGQKLGAVLQPAAPGSNYTYEMVFVSGESTRSVVDIQDIPFAGGYIQMLDNFLIPPVSISSTIGQYQLANLPFAMTAFLGGLYNLPGPNSQNGLARYLNESKDITVFVPANVAFEAVVDSLSAKSQADLAEIFNYHVLVSDNKGPLYSSDFVNGTTYRTLNGKEIELRFFPNSFFANQARILTSDILISNGVLHIIDGVLNPNATAQLPNPTSATQMPVFTPNPVSNVSDVPYSTFLPNYVAPEITSTTDAVATTTLGRASGTYGQHLTSSTTTTSAAQMGAMMPAIRGDWTSALGIWSMVAIATVLMTWEVI